MNATKLRDLLKTCEMSDEEIKTESPRIHKAFEKAGLKDADLENAKANTSKYFRSAGSRKALGLWVKRYTDAALARDEGKKLIYHVHPGKPRFNLALLYATGAPEGNVVSEFIESAIMQLFGVHFFNRLHEFVQVAEKHGMDAGVAHCGINQSGLGALETGAVPIPDLVISGGYQCDQAAKYGEFLGEHFGVPNITYDSVRDEDWGTFPETDDDCIKYFADSLRKFSGEIADFLGVEIKEEHWHRARVEYAKLWFRITEVQKLLVKSDPRPIGVVDEGVIFWAALDPDWRTAEIHECFDLLLKDARENVEQGVGVLPKGAPKINFMCPPRADISALLEEIGLNLVVSGSVNWVAPWEMGQPHRFTDDYGKVAESLIRKGYVRCGYDQVYRFAQMAKELNLDGVAYAWYWPCRVLTQCGPWIKELVEKEVGIPTMYLEHDGIDPRFHSTEQLRTRIETFTGILRARKEVKASKSDK